MSAENFERCLSEVLSHEGGYVNHPADPGGETNMGISKRSYPNEDIRGMTRARAAAIYRRDYWDRVRGDALPPGVDLVAFDAAVNSGVSRGAKWVQAAAGASQDGVIGPSTLAAVAIMSRVSIINVACDKRMSFLRGLKIWGSFGKGWTRRVSSVRGVALELAAAGGQYTPPVGHVPAPPAQEVPGNGWAGLLAMLMKLLGKG